MGEILEFTQPFTLNDLYLRIVPNSLLPTSTCALFGWLDEPDLDPSPLEHFSVASWLYREWHDTLKCDPCAYCGDTHGATDHIVPASQGGTDDWWNLTSACVRCNRVKGMRPLLDFLITPKSVPLRRRKWFFAVYAGTGVSRATPFRRQPALTPAPRRERGVMPFGKYRGEPLTVVAADDNYCTWLFDQPWFRTREATLATDLWSERERRSYEATL